MTLFTKKPVTVEASQWFKNGDHPQDHKPFETNGRTSTETDCLRYSDYLQTEGRVVRRYRHPDVSGNKICEQCGNPHHVHGWVDMLEQGHRVCPGDWIITGINGERYPCKPDVFEATYTPAQAEPAHAPVGEYPAKALEGVEPVACLVNADLGAMVWPISDINEAETYCDEGEFPELLYPAATVSALQARIATQAEHQAKALEGVQAFEFDPPPYNSAAMGCGLEDRGVTDIYDAMYYGWHEAMDRAYESIPDDLVSATTVSALRERIAELEQDAVQGALS